jgi:hypothetical protein
MELRQPSPRPTILLDRQSNALQDPPSVTQVGLPGPFGRARCLFALPLAVTELSRGVLLKDQDGAMIADPAGNVIGVARVYVHRMLYARPTEDTRRFA